MSAFAQPPVTMPGGPRRPRRLRAFWNRVTEGIELHQLWRQFLADAKATYRFYSKDVDWEGIKRDPRPIRRIARSIWAFFEAMLMKLSPVRRVLLLIAVFLLIVAPVGAPPSAQGVLLAVDFRGIGALLLFFLLMLELADRVTMKRDLEIAREIQRWLVPSEPPAVPGFEMAFATRPQNTVAGDYYDAFLRPAAPAEPSFANGTPPLLVAIADVAGKSVPAALLMATFQASLRALAATPATLANMCSALDAYARAHNLEGLRFTTAFLAEIDVASKQARYVNAGHHDPILRRANGAIERLSAGGPPFGIPLALGETNYGIGATRLCSGDLLLLFTDGLIEAVNLRDEEFGERRLLALLDPAAAGGGAPAESARDVLDRVTAQVNAFTGEARQHDDITCFALRVQ